MRVVVALRDVSWESTVEAGQIGFKAAIQTQVAAQSLNTKEKATRFLGWLFLMRIAIPILLTAVYLTPRQIPIRVLRESLQCCGLFNRAIADDDKGACA